MIPSHRFGRFELRPQPRLLLEDGRPVELGARAFDLLLTLVDRRDRLVTKSELLDLVWQGVIVEENNLQVQVSALRKVLGPDAITTLPGRGYRFGLEVEPPADEPAAANEVRSADALPRPLTSFVGRESDLAEYARLLEHTRLLTLTGVGGCGKTRLAIELARSLLASVPDGVWFVDLAPVAAPERMALTVAATLGVREEPDRPILDTVCARLEGKRALLVLDNCEHLVTACAAFIEALLAHTASAKVLATSRERLGVVGEQAAVVRPLGLAPPSADRDVREASEAVRLFVDRARLAAPDFALGADTLSAVENICRRLEGLPLAIELAAARVKVLSADEINARLDDRFRLLTAGGRAQPRHQTLRGVIDWSYEQLESREQQVFRHLSVFAGGWTLAAATAVTASSDEFETIETLSHLVDKSLVLVERQTSGQVRYRMLETVRAYAREALEAGGEAHEARERHLNYFVALAESQPAWHDMEAAAAFERLDAELENLMAAHDWCDEDTAAAESGLRLVAALPSYLRDRTQLRLGRAMLERALSRPGSPLRGRVRAKALDGAGDFADHLGDSDAATKYFAQALAMARESGDTELEIVSLRKLGGAENLAQARRYLEDSLALARANSSHYNIGAALNNLGEVCRMESKIDEAAANYEEALAIFREHGSARGAANTLFNLAIVANERLHYPQACRYVREAADEARALRSHYYECWVLQHAAALAAAVGDAHFAARMWGAFDAARGATGLALQQPDLAFLMPRIERSRVDLGEAAFAQAHAAGRALSLDEAIAEIDAWLERYLSAAESQAADGASVKS